MLARMAAMRAALGLGSTIDYARYVPLPANSGFLQGPYGNLAMLDRSPKRVGSVAGGASRHGGLESERAADYAALGVRLQMLPEACPRVASRR